MPSERPAREAAPDPSDEPFDQIHDCIAEFTRQTRLHREDMYGELTSVAYGALLFVANSECAHATDLAAASGVDKSTVSRHLTDLIGRGLLLREPDPHHLRMQRLRLTPRARRLLRRLRADQRTNLEQALGDWSAEDLKTFSALFDRFVSSISVPAVGQRS